MNSQVLVFGDPLSIFLLQHNEWWDPGVGYKLAVIQLVEEKRNQVGKAIKTPFDAKSSCTLRKCLLHINLNDTQMSINYDYSDPLSPNSSSHHDKDSITAQLRNASSSLLCERRRTKGRKGRSKAQKKIYPITNTPFPKLTSCHQFQSWPGNSPQVTNRTGSSRYQSAN